MPKIAKILQMQAPFFLYYNGTVKNLEFYQGDLEKVKKGLENVEKGP